MFFHHEKISVDVKFVKDEGPSKMCWMDLELCTGDGFKNWPKRGWFHPTKSVPEFLGLWSKDWSYMYVQIVWISLVKCSFNTVLFYEKLSVDVKFVKGAGLCIMCWMDLELCTRDGCKKWPKRGWFHPTKSLSEFLDL